MEEKYKKIIREFEQIEHELHDPTIVTDQKKLKTSSQKYNERRGLL